MKFMLINVLIESNLIDPKTLPDFSQYQDTFEDEVAEAVAYYQDYPLNPALLEKIEEICFDGGNAIYTDIAGPDWGGEGDSFDVSDLSGIEQCKNLRSLLIISMYRGGSLKPLASLIHLENIEISAYEGCFDTNALLELPKLKELSLDWDSVTDPNARQVYDRLLENGVNIELKWDT